MRGARGITRIPLRHDTHIAAGVVSQTLDQGRIIVFCFSDVAVGAIDAAADALSDLMRRCDESNRPLHLLLDLTQPGVIVTPYARECAAALACSRPRLRGRVALLAPEGTPVAHQLERFLRSLAYHYRERRLFFDRDAALAWLRETLEPDLLQ